MKLVENRFGKGELYEAIDLQGLTYAIGCACTSIQAEMLSYANAHPTKFTLLPEQATNIVVLSCQVTDLAIYNDMQYLCKLMGQYPDAENFFVGGCLARRFDIPTPNDLHHKVKRLDAIRKDGQWLENMHLIDYAPPFWVKNFKENDDAFADGHLFRDMYPLRIGVGCSGKCKYCTINTTRGDSYEIPTVNLREEFLHHKDVVLISDSPSTKQVREWCQLAIAERKPFSIRNVEPQVAMACINELLEAAQVGVLDILHVPVQALSIETLQDMGRNVNATVDFLQRCQLLREFGVKLATNVIIDYKEFPNPDEEVLDSMFDYVSWNPYWDGTWNYAVAQERFAKYLGGE